MKTKSFNNNNNHHLDIKFFRMKVKYKLKILMKGKMKFKWNLNNWSQNNKYKIKYLIHEASKVIHKIIKIQSKCQSK